jgi:hypothetical protein
VHDDADFGDGDEDGSDPGEDDHDDGAPANRNATGQSRAAQVARWLRLPHHYSLREYLESMDTKAAADKEATADARRTR